MLRQLSLIPALFVSLSAFTAEVSWTYRIATEDCAGRPVEIIQSEAYISSEPIPAADEPCPDVVDKVPQDAQRVEIVPDTNDRVTVDLPPGRHYVRMRDQATNGEWSNLSTQLHVIVAGTAQPIPRPIRDTDYDWRCVNPDGTATNHQRQDTAIFACQERALRNPGTYYVEGGRYRVER